jgi:hypothetical protein
MAVRLYIAFKRLFARIFSNWNTCSTPLRVSFVTVNCVGGTKSISGRVISALRREEADKARVLHGKPISHQPPFSTTLQVAELIAF